MPDRHSSDDLSQNLKLFSPPMREIAAIVQRVAPLADPVLITGESGTGKELVARTIHQHSKAPGLFVEINCAALPEHLIESELFGFEKGAFSGADSEKPGLFELAENGTLFLDEIGELHIHTQAKLLRILDGHAWYRLGGVRRIQLRARVVAATNRNLREAAAQGLFRRDLLHRLDVLNVEVPPLRNRAGDILPLADFFLAPTGCVLAADARAVLTAWHWPGNVRELRNVLRKAVVASSGKVIFRGDLPLELRSGLPAISRGEFCLETLERQTIGKALEASRGHQQKAAALLGISRRTLIRKLKTYRSVTPAGTLVA